MPMGIFLIFLVLYFVFKERKNKADKLGLAVGGYSVIKTLKKPIILFSKIGLCISFVLMVSIWIMMALM
jgi:hypothetical protein